MNRGGFSWNRFLGISAFKSRISRQIGIPLTRSGRQRKLGAIAEKILIIAGLSFLSLIASIIIKVKNIIIRLFG
jgi:hypothetical protein